MGTKKPPQRYPHNKMSVAREKYRAKVHYDVARDDFEDAKRDLKHATARLNRAKTLKVGDKK